MSPSSRLTKCRAACISRSRLQRVTGVTLLFATISPPLCVICLRLKTAGRYDDATNRAPDDTMILSDDSVGLTESPFGTPPLEYTTCPESHAERPLRMFPLEYALSRSPDRKPLRNLFR